MHSSRRRRPLFPTIVLSLKWLCFFFCLNPCLPAKSNHHYSNAAEVVQSMNQQVKNGESLVVFKDSTNQVHSSTYKKSCKKLDISKLKAIEIDEEGLVAHVEPCVDMETLVDACLARGLLPVVAPEFRRITVGGAVMGAALESSSHAHGQFHDACAYLTLLTGDGRRRTCSPASEPALFHGVSGSYGSLGVLLGAGVRLERAGPAVRVRCKVYSSPEQALLAIEMACRPIDGEPPPGGGGGRARFVDALALPPQQGGKVVVMTADYCDGPDREAGETLERLDRPWDKWYFERVRERAHGRGLEEWTWVHPARDYIFRYDRGCFWMARPLAFSFRELTPATFFFFLMTDSNLLSRLLFRWLYTAGRLYRVLGRAPPKVVAQKIVAMDIYCPLRHAAMLIDYVRCTVPISTPLWLCPVRPASACHPPGPAAAAAAAAEDAALLQPLAPHAAEGPRGGLLVNVGVYGRVSDGQGHLHSRRLEHWAAAHRARKMLYSQNFYSEEEFWNIYDKEAYRSLRERYRAEGRFPDVYTKTCADSRALLPRCNKGAESLDQDTRLRTKVAETIANLLM